MSAVTAPEPTPMMEINTTPLIDVMLVLLVMMIITIPPQHHAVTVDLPVGPPVVDVDRVKNRLVVSAAGATYWNGTAVSDGQLRLALTASATMTPSPELHFQPEAGARYARVDQILAMSEQAGVMRMGFVGNEQYARAL